MRRRRPDGWLSSFKASSYARSAAASSPAAASARARAAIAGTDCGAMRTTWSNAATAALASPSADRQVGVRREGRVRGTIARGRRALSPCAKPIAQPRPTGGARELDEAPREIVVVRAFEQRALGALEQRGRIGAVNLPVRARRRRYGEGYEQGQNERQTPHTGKIAPPEPPSRARPDRIADAEAKKTGPRARTIAGSRAVRGP